jgi:outer membrane receptor protein involved in Fe transport
MRDVTTVLKTNHLCGASVITVLMCCAAGGPAGAQTSTAAGAGHTIDELIVTAQKRTQSLQDVPIVVTSVNAQQLQDAGVRDIKDLTIVTPGLTVTTTSSSAITTARIRGIGTVGDNFGLESSVGVVIDGVYRPRNGVAFSDLGDMERIEVLKGPQGTLFGKNTTAGVINVITKRPETSFSANSEATFSNYDGFGVAGSVTGPIAGDQLAGRLYAAGREHEGYYKRSVGPAINNQDFYTVRGQLLYRPTEKLDVNFAADYTKRHELCCGAVQIANGPTAGLVNLLAPGGIAIPPNPDALRDYGTRSDLSETVDKGVQAELNWDTGWFGGAKLTSITAYRDWRTASGLDNDWTGADIIYAPSLGQDPTTTRFRTFTEEVRLAGETGRLNWLVGGFYSDEKLDQHNRYVTLGAQFEPYLDGLLRAAGLSLSTFTGQPLNGTMYAPGSGQNDHYHQKERGSALFTNNSFKITDQLELTVGARYNWEKKDLNSLWTNPDGGIGCATSLARLGAVGRTLGSAYALLCSVYTNPKFAQVGANAQHLTESKLTGTVKLAYRFTPEVLTYVSYARGYKAGGFNLDRNAGLQPAPGVAAAPVLDTSFKPELVDSYEVGVKNTLLNRTLLLNATAFYQSYADFQLNTFNGLVFNVVSAPKVVAKGVDADFVWFTPVEGLSLNGGATYAMTYYPKSTPLALGGNLPGSRLSLAPLWSASLAGTYEHHISEHLIGRIAINAKHTSTYNTGSDLDPVRTQGPLTLINGRVAIASDDKRWSLEAWGLNLTDRRYYQVAFASPFQGSGAYDAYLGQPRTYGMTLRFSY